QFAWVLEALNMILGMNETIDIVQMSFGGYGVFEEINTVMEQLVSAGVIPVVSAGNSGPYGHSISRPAHSPFTIAVGASGEPDEVMAFSSQGPRLYGLAAPDLIAPGYNVEVASHEDEESTTYQNGTSFASPFVSGGVALLLSGDASINASKNEARFWKLKAALMSSAKALDQYPSVAVGAGFVDLDAAFETLTDDVVVSIAPNRISSSNYFFQISTNGEIKTFPISIYSADTYEISYQDTELPSGVNVNLTAPNKLHIGLNVLNLSIEIDPDLKMDKYQIIIDIQIGSKLLNLEIDLENKYSGGRILWDLRYDNDTNNSAFSNGYFGDNSNLAYLLSSVGRSSAAIVSNESDFYNTGYTYQAEEIVQALEKHDLLVISDPEFSYSSSEITFIQSWVGSGKSLLVVTDFDNETESGTQTGTEHSTLNALLSSYGIEITNQLIPETQNRTVFGTTIPKDSSGMGPFSSRFSFDFVGVALEVTENSNTKTIASFDNNAIAAVHMTTSGGAIAVVGSSFPLSNLAYYVPNSENNFKFAWQLIEWLLNMQQPIARFTYSANNLAFLGLESDSKFEVSLSGREGRINPVDQFESFSGTLVEYNGNYLQITFRKKGDAFEASWEPTTSGIAVLYVNIQIPGYAPLNGALQVDVIGGDFPIFLILLLVLVALGVGFIIYSTRKRKSLPDYRSTPAPRTIDASVKQDQMFSNSKRVTETPSQHEVRCISCNAPLFPGAAFCEKCGTRQVSKETIKAKTSCPKCGASIRLTTAQFCEFCGNKLGRTH
ncbi:MAG: S8 family serine peptidase, partial [Candidatus Hodarchaeota archaeon]